IIGERERDCHLTIVLLAELSAILPRDPNRVPPLFGKPSVVDDPRRNGAVPLNPRDRVGSDTLHYGVVRPLTLPNEMQQRLVLCSGSRRCRQRCYRSTALTLYRQQQARTIANHCRTSPSVAKHARQLSKIGRKALRATTAILVSHDSSWS